MSAFRFIAAMVPALAAGAVYAQSPAPLTQGISSVEKNLERAPDNKGLQNASQRLKDNQERFEGRLEARAERVDRPEVAQRPERAAAERPPRPDRAARR